MKNTRQKIDRKAEKLIARGQGRKHVAMCLIRAGIDIARDEEGISARELIVHIHNDDTTSLEWPTKGHRTRVVPQAMMSVTSIEEFLDYASACQVFDENTPNGVNDEIGGPMNDFRRGAIVLLKKVLGLLPHDYKTSMPDYSDVDVPALIFAVEQALTQFSMYAEHHDAKGTTESREKADVNREFVKMCAAALGKRANFPPRTPQERDSGLPAPVEAPGARTVSSAPLDRAEMLAILDMKIAGSNKAGMTDTASVLKALRGEIVQHLEAAPIDFAVALNAFYDDCHARNVKAGWWSDLATGLPKKRSVGELFILFVTELWEAYDAYVNGSQDDKLPQYPGIGVELGDLQIRLADFCGALAAGRIVECSGVGNPGDLLFCEIGEIASRYERIRKTPEAVGEVELGEPLDSMTVGEMVVEKLAFNAQRADHKPENRKLEGGKQT